LKVNVHFYGFVRDVVDTSRIAIETSQDISVRELLDLASKRFGEALRERLLSGSGELQANVRVFVGEHETASLEAPIIDGQNGSAEVKVFVLSATAGG